MLSTDPETTCQNRFVNCFPASAVHSVAVQLYIHSQGGGEKTKKSKPWYIFLKK